MLATVKKDFKISEDLISISEASKWASEFLNKNVSDSNIAYLIQYALIRKFNSKGVLKVSLSELKNYYTGYAQTNHEKWNKHSDAFVNWALAFDKYKESETTKHVHRLHPYKGKFIPQLVEYFLDSHIDNFKKDVYFNQGDIILDPFCGSGTTLVQANELGINAIGIDVSIFNTLISNCKTNNVNISELEKGIADVTNSLNRHYRETNISKFEDTLIEELNAYNKKYFSNYEYKFSVRNKTINEKEYAQKREMDFLPIYYSLIEKYSIDLSCDEHSFLSKWFLPRIREELHFAKNIIANVVSKDIKNILSLILSRTMRSCRATTHSDLATLLKPVTTAYYCTKHYKICKPLFSITKWWETYSKDTLKRLKQFNKIRTSADHICITGDSRNIDLYKILSEKNSNLFKLLKEKKISGIFSSPPYVGLIDYHEQHAYAYELFNLSRMDELEIGSLHNGQSFEARKSYVEDISTVLLNCKKYLKNDYNIFLVANDKYNLYQDIAKRSKMKIFNKYVRPVLNRTEKAKNSYSENIFHLKEA